MPIYTGGTTMAGAKIVVIYPRPQDEAAFEEAYKNVHLPMCEENLKGMNRLVATKVLNSPQGETRTYRIAEVHFSNDRGAAVLPGNGRREAGHGSCSSDFNRRPADHPNRRGRDVPVLVRLAQTPELQLSRRGTRRAFHPVREPAEIEVLMSNPFIAHDSDPNA